MTILARVEHIIGGQVGAKFLDEAINGPQTIVQPHFGFSYNCKQ